jgi:alginate O-acetyltransferase complex protein AlgI
MQFHTWIFGLFFLVFYPLYLALTETPLRALRLKVPLLLAASYFFYGWYNPRYPLVLLYATVVDYLVVLAMDRTRWKKPWLLLSIANNLALLGYYKYSVFLVDSLNGLLHVLSVPYAVPIQSGDLLGHSLAWAVQQAGLPYAIPAASALPVGISFFVFRSLTYTIDFYRGKVAKETNLLRYATFVAFFPELLMGPIDRAAALLPQLRGSRRISGQDVADGLSLIVVGLFKKVALADYLALYVNKVYAAPGEFDAPALLLASFVFAWQIYFDFSGYSDMARGVGRLLGFNLTLNFDNPYLATGLGDFWRRWHISLSNWFKDYVYIPLGGNRRGEVRTYVNMCLTMVISGLWHGPMWTFVLWGAVHAAGRVVMRPLEAAPFYQQRVPTVVKQLLTFAIVTFAWIFFRAASIGDALQIVGRIAAFRWADPLCPLAMLGLIAAVWLYQFLCESRARWVLQLAPVRIALIVIMVVYLATFAGSSNQGFIYEQF